MIPTRVCDILHIAKRNARIDQFIRVRDERVPLVIVRHGDRPCAEFLDGVVCLVCLTLEYAGICVICFLNLAYNDGFELATRMFQIQEGLENVSTLPLANWLMKHILGAGSFPLRFASQFACLRPVGQ